MWLIDIIKSWFCKHEYVFVRNIHGDEINWCGGYRSIWRCKKCGKLQYREQLELSLAEKLHRNSEQYYINKYNNWKKYRNKALNEIIDGMIDNSHAGRYWYEIILLCEEKYNDRNYYCKWLDENELKYDFKLYNQKEACDEINQYKFTIKWDKN